MAREVSSENLTIPFEDWEKLVGKPFKPFSLLFGASGYPMKKHHLYLTSKTMGATTTTVARVLAFYCVTSDLGRYFLKKFLRYTGYMLDAQEKVDKAAFSTKEEYSQWKREQQEAFFECFKEFEEEEKRRAES